MMYAKGNIKDIYPLSPMQEGILFHYLYDKNSTAYFEQVSYRCHGTLDMTLVEASLNALFARHDILRTAFVYEGLNRPLQVVLKTRSIDFHYEDLQHLATAQEKEKQIADFCAVDKKRGFNLSQDVLMRVTIFQFNEHEYELIWSHYHILMDGWCMGIFLTEFYEYYNSFVQQREPVLPAVTPYRHYIEWLEKKDRSASKKIWMNYLSGYEGVTRLPGRKGDDKNDYTNRQYVYGLDAERTRALQALAIRHRVTLSTVVQTLWGILLSKYNGRQDVIFGAVVSVRPPEIEGIESIIGLFINTVPIRITWKDQTRFSELLSDAQNNALVNEPHYYFPLADIQAASGIKDLIDHIVVLQNFPLPDKIEGLTNGIQQDNQDLRLEISRFDSFSQDSYDFNLTISPGECLEIRLDYNAQVYDDGFMHSITGYLVNLIDCVLRDPEIRIGSMDGVTATERIKLLALGRGAEHLLPDTTLVERFTAQAMRCPDALAVRCGDETLSYSDLHIQSDRLAYELHHTYHIGKGDIVGLMMDRSEKMIVGMLGILKSGAAYLPIDASHPAARRMAVLRSCDAAMLITDASRMFEIGDFDKPLMALDIQLSTLSGAGDLATTPSAGDTAYVIYTSGTTGEPKGVAITHRSLMNYLSWFTGTYQIGVTDSTVLLSSIAFDLCYTSLWGSLVSGASLHILPEQRHADPSALSRLLVERQITFLKLTPSHLQWLLNAAGFAEEVARYSLRLIVTGGEAIRVEDLERYFSHRRDVVFVNHYGPTETTIGTIARSISWEDFALFRKRVVLGRPISNSRIYIVDDQERLVPVGVWGEICVSGYGLSPGYLNNVSQSARSFVADPFHAGERMYKTGDIGCWTPSGEIAFSGRSDGQLKVRGYRVELGEIESVLKQVVGVAGAVVLADTSEGDVELVGYAWGEGLEGEVLRSYASEHLPSYMVPSKIIVVDEVPLTQNGKLDRQALRALSSGYECVSYEGPRTAQEEALSKIWAEVLGKARVGIRDNFFTVGGHSLKAVQIASRIYKTLEVRVDLRDIFEHPTIESLSGVIAGKSPEVYEPIVPLPEQEYYDVSHAQKRLWILDQLEGGKIAHNIPMAYVLENLDQTALKRALETLVLRHESLRTIFVWSNGTLKQKIMPGMSREFCLQENDLRGAPVIAEEIKTWMCRETEETFDLAKGPLLRARLLRTDENKFLFLFTMHHILSDGWSRVVMFEELMILYNAYALGKENPLKPLQIQYKDFTAWQNAKINGKEETYWLRKLADKPDIVRLPYAALAKEDEFDSAHRYFELGEVEAARVNAIAKENKTSVSNVILALYGLFLQQVSDQNDLLVGVGHANRDHPDVEKLIGFFVNILVIRMTFQEGQTFDELVRQVAANTSEAFSHAHYPYELLLEKLTRDRKSLYNSLVNVTYSFQNFRDISVNIDAYDPASQTDTGIPLLFSSYQYDSPNKTSRAHLHLIASERPNALGFRFEYNANLFNDHVIDNFIAIMKHLVVTLNHASPMFKNTYADEIA